MTAPVPAFVASVRDLLPSDAERFGWDDDKIIVEWTGHVISTVRRYWLQRVNDTAGYVDLGAEGLPISQIHAQAKAMLAYYDNWLAQYGDSVLPIPGRVPVTFGTIRNRYRRDCSYR